MICLSCTETSIDANLQIINKNREFIDLVEIRVDFLNSSEYDGLHTIPDAAGLPCILTFRKPADGGINTSISNEERVAVMLKALEGGWRYIDIEDDADTDAELQLMKAAEAAGTRIILSFHDFTGVPANLAERMIENSKGDRYIPKAAVMPESTADLLRIFDAHRQLSDMRSGSQGFSCTNGPLLSDYILVGMGSVGVPSRIMASAWGGMLTFCSAGSTEAAPGHISPAELVNVYNYNALSGESIVLGIIGNPVMHSRSPNIHNAAIKSNSLDAVYLPFETDQPELLLSHSAELGLRGLSVTIPHKQRVKGLADSIDNSVQAIGACNTLVCNSSTNEWRGYNTDWIGFLKPLEGMELENRKALVIGAGGAARAVVYALVKQGMDVLIVNRSSEKAISLAADFGCRGGGFELLDDTDDCFPLVVQTTSLGMEPNIEDNPVPGFDFSGVETAYDIIYTPEKTAFLASAESAGCRIINGFPMLKAQAVEQFRLFTGCVME
ncbi:MAG: shikimate dehydrogenase [Spirochaetales bacterium]|uniref:Shikimate dehydrogenase (NADP(+)) n=1 Tax=Candidatus Thalassospirochaeta sargassi TaxID=3119039 RepID=A0AAJ1IAI4_9SPIO|nr:shikimate dehydrogenase [Spirochaetales bacterium]